MVLRGHTAGISVLTQSCVRRTDGRMAEDQRVALPSRNQTAQHGAGAEGAACLPRAHTHGQLASLWDPTFGQEGPEGHCPWLSRKQRLPALWGLRVSMFRESLV